jgi:hypothetical protein
MGTRLIIVCGDAGWATAAARARRVDENSEQYKSVPPQSGCGGASKMFFYLDFRSSLMMTRLSLSGQDRSTASPCHHGIAPPNWKHCSDGKML